MANKPLYQWTWPSVGKCKAAATLDEQVMDCTNHSDVTHKHLFSYWWSSRTLTQFHISSCTNIRETKILNPTRSITLHHDQFMYNMITKCLQNPQPVLKLPSPLLSGEYIKTRLQTWWNHSNTTHNYCKTNSKKTITWINSKKLHIMQCTNITMSTCIPLVIPTH